MYMLRLGRGIKMDSETKFAKDISDTMTIMYEKSLI